MPSLPPNRSAASADTSVPPTAGLEGGHVVDERAAPAEPSAYSGSILADSLSLCRVPLGLAFLFVADRPPLALALLTLGGVTDVLDGWVARRGHAAGPLGPHRGDWLDPLCDKIFVATTMLGLYLARRPPLALVLLVLLRELLQVVAFATFKLLPPLRRRGYVYRAHRLGKATTVAQFCTAVTLVGGRGPTAALAVLTGALGLASVAFYVRRGLTTASARSAHF